MAPPHPHQRGHAATDIEEVSFIPPGRSWLFYLVLVFIVIPLWSTIPIAWMSVIYTLWFGSFFRLSWTGKTWFAIAFCEVGKTSCQSPTALTTTKVLFSVHHYDLVRSISGPPSNSPRNLEDTKAAFVRVLKCGLANVAEGNIDEESLDEAIPSSPSEPIVRLMADDPRALDFRESIRVWYVCLAQSSSVCDKSDHIKVSQSDLVVHQKARYLLVSSLGVLQQSDASVGVPT